MPVFHIRSPEGLVISVNAPDANTAMQGAQQWAQQNQGYLRARADANQVETRSRNAPFGNFGEAATNAAAFGFGPQIAGAADAAATGLRNFVGGFTGQKPAYGMADAYAAGRDANNAANNQWRQQHPVAEVAANLATVPLVGPERAAATLAAKTVPAIGVQMGKNAAAGAALGALAGAGHAQPAGGPGGDLMQDLGARASAAANAAPVGAAMGAALPIAAKGVGAVINGGAGLAQGAQRMASPVWEAMTGAPLVSPETIAAQRLAARFGKDGVTSSADLAALANQWRGASQPTLLDLGGENVRALTRVAGMDGPARNMAQQYADQVAGDLQDNALSLTRGLTPDVRAPNVVQQEALDTRDSLADQQYPAAYETPITLGPAAAALRGEAGQVGIANARIGASARMRDQQLADLNAIKNLDEGDIGFLQAGTVDRLRQGFNAAGRAAQTAGNNDAAAGYFQRASMLDNALDGIQPLKDARASYRDWSQRANAIDAGALGTNASPPDFQEAAGAYTPGQMPYFQVGYRGALEDMIGRPTEGATGTLNRIATSTNSGQNLATAFGPQAADAYTGGLQDELSRLANARFISPNANSKTANVEFDLSKLNPHHLLASALEKLGGGGMSDAEREAIVGAATGNNFGLVDAGQPSVNVSPLAQALIAARAVRPAALLITDQGGQQGGN